ncbi:MAG: alpha/beta fold hydrolase, partial [Bacteroidetes bacterium]
AEGFVKAVFYERSFEAKPEAITMIRDIINGNNQTGVAGTLLALAARTDTTSSLQNINVPTLFLVGEHDAITPFTSSRTMREHIPKAEWHIIPDSAHMSNLENTEGFNKHLLSFLAKLTSH